jgi:energy-coupling factor transporter ATP-binding protein EcfA2
MMIALQTKSPLLTKALKLPNGARYFRCALQVNPFSYVIRHKKQTTFKTEDAYNAALIAACRTAGVQVIGVTDHYRIRDSAKLIAAAREAGLHAFGGFEAVSKDGVHFLCLFDPDKDDAIERFIGQCGILDSTDPSPTGKLDAEALLREVINWRGIGIAAHVAADQGGLLKKLSGKSRINVWRSEHLLACALAGPVDEAPQGLQAILTNRDHEHRRDRPVAIINAQDVSDPSALNEPGATCLIKMSEVSVEALRQAFLDPESRVRLNTEPEPESHVEFLAISWEGGFLGDAAVRFNENLNVLIGGRGAGKSTVVESLRYVLGVEPLGEDARAIHDGFVDNVLRSGTKISLLVRSPHPTPRVYTIERAVPDPPNVRDESGELLELQPHDVVPGAEIYGQHEISELTRSPEKLTRLLNRFIESDGGLDDKKDELQESLRQSRSEILELQHQIRANEERLAALPKLEEELKRFQDAGLEDKLKARSNLLTEEACFKSAAGLLAPFATIQTNIAKELPLEVPFLEPEQIQTLPNADLLSEVANTLRSTEVQLGELAKRLQTVLAETTARLSTLSARWQERRKPIDEEYKKILRELHKVSIDGDAFIRLRRQIQQLRPTRTKQDSLSKEIHKKEKHRGALVTAWEEAKAAEYRLLEKAAKSVSRKLSNRVRISVAMCGNRAPLEDLLREELGGKLTPLLDRLREREQFSLRDFVASSREGKAQLIGKYKAPPGAAEKLAEATPDQLMRIEELELPATTAIELNTSPDGAPPAWKSLADLSTGQKATAVLLLLLLESDAPLIVDQPEDDLDNRFITESVVPIMRREKRRRQFVFSTHNANIPVLGDAELILGLTATGEADGGQARIEPKHMASIDAKPVRELVEEILEGGKTAFEMRRRKYNF